MPLDIVIAKRRVMNTEATVWQEKIIEMSEMEIVHAKLYLMTWWMVLDGVLRIW